MPISNTLSKSSSKQNKHAGFCTVGENPNRLEENMQSSQRDSSFSPIGIVTRDLLALFHNLQTLDSSYTVVNVRKRLILVGPDTRRFKKVRKDPWFLGDTNTYLQ